MKGDREQITLRIPDGLNERVKTLAKELGISRNSTILVLIEDGYIVRKKGFIPQKL
jgi:predicted DNA-binding protein